MVELRLGKRTLHGPLALGLLLLVLAGIVALLAWSRPSPGMWIAGGIWLGYLVYWSRTAASAGRWRDAESAASRARHTQRLNLGLLLLFVSIPGLRWPFLPPFPARVPAGLLLMAAATLLHVWARTHLGRNWSSPVRLAAEHQLVRTGPYRFVRHPIYTALVALALGTAIVSGRVMSLAGAALFLFAYVRKLQLEERVLAERFGDAWVDYRRRSWALVPGMF